MTTVDDTRHSPRGKDAGSLDMQAYRGDRGRGIAGCDVCQPPWLIFRAGL